MSEETIVKLTERERQLLLGVLLKLPIQVTLENINNNKTVNELAALVKKLHPPVLKSKSTDDTIIEEEK